MKRYCSIASVTSRAVRASSVRIQRLTLEAGVVRLETRDRGDAVHLGEARRVPELGAEIAVAGDAARIELHVPALRRHDGQREAQRIGAVFVDQFERIDDVALRLRHLRAVLVAHQGMDIDGVERLLLHEVQAHHHHPGDPEEDDVEAGHQRAGRVVGRQFRRLVRPAERRERPERRGEPGVEHVLVALEDLARPVVFELVLDPGLPGPSTAM